MFDRIRRAGPGREVHRPFSRVDRRFESALDRLVVGVVVVDALPIDRTLAATQRDVDVFRPDSLDLLEKIDVCA